MWVKGQRVRAGVYRFQFSTATDPDEMIFILSGLGQTLTPDDVSIRAVKNEVEVTLLRAILTGGGVVTLHAFLPQLQTLSRKPRIQPPKSSS